MKGEGKTKGQLIEELAELRQRLVDLEASEAQRKRAEWALGERMKELTCLYMVSRDMQEDLSTDELCRRVIEHLVPAMQFPEITVPVIELDGRRFTSERYTEGLSHGLHAEIRVEGEAHGHLWVYYAEDRPFLIPEEQSLINAVAEDLGLWLERKQAGEELQKSEKRYRNLFDGVPVGLCRTTPDGQILDINPALLAMLGFPNREAVLAATSADGYVNPEDRARWQALMDREGVVRDYETQLRRWDGTTIWVEIHARAIRDADGQMLYYESSMKDITERKRAEEEAQQRATQAALAYEVGQRVSSKLQLDELLSEIVTAVRDAFDYYGVMILLVDEKANCLTMQSIAGGYADIFPRDLCHAIGEGMTGYAAASGQTQVSGDVSKDPHYVREADEETKSELAVPIKSRQKVIGVLDLQSDQFDAFDEIDVMAMETLADQIAVAIENARLYEAVQQKLTERQRAEEELIRLSSAVKMSADSIVIADLEGKIVDVNEAALKMYGTDDKGDLIGQYFLGLIAPEQRKKALVGVQAVLERGYDRSRGYEVIIKDGSRVPVELSAAVMKDTDGEPTGFVGIARDITERQRAEEALRESKQLLERTFASLRDAVFIIDADTVEIMDCNPAASEIFGYSRDEMLGRTTTFLHVDEGTLEEFRRHLYPAIEEKGYLSHFEFRMKHKDGSVFPTEHSVMPLQDEGGKRIGWVSVVRDITKRQRAEEALRESERRLKEAQAMGRIGDWKFDIDNQKITWSDQVFKLYERDPGLGAPTPEEEATYYSPEQARILREYARRSIETGEEFEYDLEVKLPSGWTGYFSACMHPIKDESGRVVELFGTVQDITDRKRAEEKVRRHLERAEALREIDRAVTSTLDLPRVLDIILEELERVIPYHSAGIFLFSNGTAKLTAGRGFSDLERVLQVSFPVKEDPLTRELMQEKRPLVLADAQADERFLARGGTEYVRSWIGVPLIAKGRAVGFLTVDHREPGVYGEENAEMVQTFASQAAIAIENARLYHESQRRAEEMAALREVNLATLSTLERDQVFEIMLDQLGTVIDHDTAAIKIITPDGRDKMIAGRGPIIYDQPMWNGFDVKDNKLVQEMKETGRPVVVHDAHTDERYKKVGDWEAFHSWAGAPLFVRGDMIGYLAVEKASPGFYNENAVQLLGDFARAAAIALENARLYEDIQQELAERKRAEQELLQRQLRLSVLNRMGQALAGTLELTSIYRIAYEHVAQLVDCPCFGISLYDPTTRILRAEFMLDDGELIDAARFPPLDMDIEPTRGRVRAIATRQPEIIVDFPTVTEGLDVHVVGAPGDERVVGSAMYVPMVVQGQVMGLLEVQSYQLDAYSAEEAELLGPVANQIGLAIQNARLYEQAQQEIAERKQAQEGLRQSYAKLEKALEGTVQVLVSATEMRDPYTAGHQRRVTQLACAIANEMSLPEEQMEGIRMTGLIHDLGKISVPAEILSKPAQLTELEFGLIKMHPQTGHNILKTVEFPWPVADIVLQHHERMDGSGYPQGLSGEEILLEARILGVADVVEAMASHRPYRSAQGIDKALEEISQNKGTLYDPEVVDVCLRLFTEKGFEFE